MLNQIISERSGQPLEKVEQDTDRDNFMSAQEALSYGMIDKIVAKGVIKEARSRLT